MGHYTERYNRLNTAQKEAVDTVYGPVLVVAGPGSGKTELLALRVANILKETDILPQNILCLTFTDAARSNMRERLQNTIGTDSVRVAIHTFHSLAHQLLETGYRDIPSRAGYTPLSDIDRVHLLQGLLATLPHTSPLRQSDHTGLRYAYQRATFDTMNKLKEAGITPADFAAEVAALPAQLDWVETRILPLLHLDMVASGKWGRALSANLESLRTEEIRATESKLHYAIGFIQAWILAIERMQSRDEKTSYKECSAIRDKTLAKHPKTKEMTLVERLQGSKLTDLTKLYTEYQTELSKRNALEYTDLLLQSIALLEENPGVQATFMEQYQFVLIDEFQDTNPAQMRLISLITTNSDTIDEPNIMAVGDDDQAIYRFQGAELGNILGFIRTYPSTKLIVLEENYRSHQHILDAARGVIRQGQVRLEGRHGVVKPLRAAGSQTTGLVHYCHFAEHTQSLEWLAEGLRKRGYDGSTTACIARDHATLRQLSTILTHHGVAHVLKREQSIFEVPLIQVLLDILSGVAGDELGRLAALTRVVAHPAFALPRLTVWQILSTRPYSPSELIQTLVSHTDTHVARIGEFFAELTVAAATLPVAEVLDLALGSTTMEQSDGDTYTSPLRAYYFPADTIHSDTYQRCLLALRVLTDTWKEESEGTPTTTREALSYLQTLQSERIELKLPNTKSGSEAPIVLTTAHGAKGLEFDTVYILRATAKHWASSPSSGASIPLPLHLPVRTHIEEADDFLRLLFVAMTRAKTALYILEPKSDGGKAAEAIPFLLSYTENAESYPYIVHEELGDYTPDKSIAEYPLALPKEKVENYTPNEQSWLRTVVSDIALSATHITNFLDVTRGGPQTFLERNILQFPTAKTGSMAYGTAVHKAIELLQRDYQTNDRFPSLKQFLDFFVESLRHQQLSPTDLALYQGRGEEYLRDFYPYLKTFLKPEDEAEVNMKGEYIRLNDTVALTGKLDLIHHINAKEISVHDWKTGAPFESLSGRVSPTKQSKQWQYRVQLICYSIMLRRSPRYQGKVLTSGAVHFVEPEKDGETHYAVPYSVSTEEEERYIRIITKIYEHVQALNFPDTSRYAAMSFGGITAFEEDLLSGRI